MQHAVCGGASSTARANEIPSTAALSCIGGAHVWTPLQARTGARQRTVGRSSRTPRGQTSSCCPSRRPSLGRGAGGTSRRPTTIQTPGRVRSRIGRVSRDQSSQRCAESPPCPPQPPSRRRTAPSRASPILRTAAAPRTGCSAAAESASRRASPAGRAASRQTAETGRPTGSSPGTAPSCTRGPLGVRV
jgi:hypothetical protein